MCLAAFAAGGLPGWVEALPWCGDPDPGPPRPALRLGDAAEAGADGEGGEGGQGPEGNIHRVDPKFAS